MALRLPLFGPLLRLLVTARFCRTLSTLVGNGVDLPTAIALSRGRFGEDRLGEERIRRLQDVDQLSALVVRLGTSPTLAEALATEVLRRQTAREFPDARAA